MRKYSLAASLIVAVLASTAVSAQNWNPRPGWKDSYSVGGRCYCDSNGYDHGIGDQTYDTPAGTLAIPQICADIQSALGTGSANGRIPYNDIQCGNGPANDAADEAGCPGRVDIGNAGCNVKGPTWDLDAVYSGNPGGNGDALDRSNWSAGASRSNGSAGAAIDGRANTRWSTTQKQASQGQRFDIDMGSRQTFSRIVLDSSGSSNDYPRSYNVQVSNNGNNWSTVASGNGNNAVTTISFTEQNARFLRINQTGTNNRFWWSIHEINAFD